MLKGELSDEDFKRLTSQPLVANLGSLSAGGEMRTTLIRFEAQTDGSFLFYDFEYSGLVNNLRRNPKSSLLISTTEWPYVGVHYEGAAQIEEPDDKVARIAKIVSRYLGSLDEATGYAERLAGYGKVALIRFRPRVAQPGTFDGDLLSVRPDRARALFSRLAEGRSRLKGLLPRAGRKLAALARTGGRWPGQTARPR